MKAGIYLGKENVEVREIPTPELDDNDVLIKNIYSSVCGTDVAVFELVPIPDTRFPWAGSLDTRPSRAWSPWART